MSAHTVCILIWEEVIWVHTLCVSSYERKRDPSVYPHMRGNTRYKSKGYMSKGNENPSTCSPLNPPLNHPTTCRSSHEHVPVWIFYFFFWKIGVFKLQILCLQKNRMLVSADHLIFKYLCVCVFVSVGRYHCICVCIRFLLCVLCVLMHVFILDVLVNLVKKIPIKSDARVCVFLFICPYIHVCYIHVCTSCTYMIYIYRCLASTYWVNRREEEQNTTPGVGGFFLIKGGPLAPASSKHGTVQGVLRRGGSKGTPFD